MVYGDLTNLSGLAGQNSSPLWTPPNTPAEKFFGSHYIVMLPGSLAPAVPGGPYLDPSYGRTYASAAGFETAAVAGYAVLDPLFPPTGTRFVVRMPSGSPNIGLFTTPPVAAATLSAPASGATGLPLSTTLSWLPVSGATRYDVYYSTDPSLPSTAATKVVFGVPGTSYSPGDLSSGTTYYWGVVASNCLYRASGSVIRSFSTAP